MVGEEEYDELSLEGLGSELPCYGVRAGKQQNTNFDAPNCPQVCGSEHLSGDTAAAVGTQPRDLPGSALQSEHC